MRTALINADRDARQWADLLGSLPAADLYSHPDYLRVLSDRGDGEACAFVARHEADIWFYPFLRKPIHSIGNRSVTGNWSDIQSPYGYAGPLSNSEDGSFIAAANESFHEWCVAENIIAEFVRFHPLMATHQFVSDDCRVLEDRETVVVRIPHTKDELWEQYPSVQRNMVRKAAKNGLATSLTNEKQDLHDFVTLYQQTMQRLDADQAYRFDESFFQKTQNCLGERVKLFVVRAEDKIVAAAFFLRYGEYLHYHLAGSDRQYRSLGCNNLLIHAALEWACDEQLDWLHLGGGTSSLPSDPLLKFKSSFSRERRTFRIGFRIHHPEKYDRLCRDWVIESHAVEIPQFFLLYRLPIAEYANAS